MMLIGKQEMAYSGLPSDDENPLSCSVIPVLFCCLSLCRAWNLSPGSYSGFLFLCWTSEFWLSSIHPLSCHNSTSVFPWENDVSLTSMWFGWNCEPHASHSSHQIPLATVIGSRMGTWPSLDQWESGLGLCLELLGKSSGPGTLRRGLELPTFRCGESLPGSKANAEEGRAERLKNRGVADGVIWTPGSNRVRSVCCLSRRKSQFSARESSTHTQLLFYLRTGPKLRATYPAKI